MEERTGSKEGLGRGKSQSDGFGRQGTAASW